MKSKLNYYWLLLIFPLLFVIWFYNSNRSDRPLRDLAYYGPKNARANTDTLYHRVPEFDFVNQFNEHINNKNTDGKIYVTEYFFTTCQSICPIMNTNLERVYQKYKDRSDFLILSHTVDPETDSVSVLKSYAEQHGVTNKNWLFLTGKKTELYSLARKGYLLNAEEGNGGEEDFIHTQNFALIDKERHIRGFYDGTDTLDVNRMIQDIDLLMKAYDYKNISQH